MVMDEGRGRRGRQTKLQTKAMMVEEAANEGGGGKGSCK